MRRVVLVLAALGMLAFAPAARAETAPKRNFAGALPTLPDAPYFHFDAADALVPEVALFDAPGAAAAIGALTNPTWEGYPLAFLVRQTRGDWLQVHVPARPNGSLAWIKRSDVNLRPLLNRIVVEVAARRLTVFHGNQVLFQTTVAVGTDATPTPLGEFYLDIFWHPPPGGPYGVALLSVAGFSEVHESFGGGIGQIAIHGTNRPGLIGQAVSNGCIRMTNEDITQVEALTAVGTPVTIVA